MRALRAFTIVVLGLGLLAAACGGSGTKKDTPAQSKAKITAAWEKFFDPAIPLDQKTNLLENYDKLKATAEEQSKNPIAAGLKAKVSDISLSSDTAAKVTYDLLNTKTNEALLKGSIGNAVKVGENWEVSQTTFCGLVGAGGGKCPT
jgi:hypothetical protein